MRLEFFVVALCRSLCWKTKTYFNGVDGEENAKKIYICILLIQSYLFHFSFPKIQLTSIM